MVKGSTAPVCGYYVSQWEKAENAYKQTFKW